MGQIMRHYKNSKGFSLAEVMVAIVILGIAACGVMVPFTAGASVRAEGLNRTLAAKLASNLMERIINTDFDPIVDDYDGYTEDQGELLNVGGEVLSDTIYSKFSREATCSYIYVPQETGAAQVKFILVTVVVYYDGEQIAVIKRLITK